MRLVDRVKRLFNLFKKAKRHDNRGFSNQLGVINLLSNDEIHPIYSTELANGLVPGEVVLLDWIEGKKSSAETPGYFKYTYGLNVNKSLKKLINNGLLENASSIESLESLKVSDLKDILKENNLKVSEKKSELVSKLKENSMNINIDSYINDTFLKVTNKGNGVLREFYYIVPAHKNDSKDGVYCIATAIDFINNNDLNFKLNNSDISWALFQKSYLKNHSNKMYGLARNNLHALAKQLHRENRLKHSLKLYLSVCILDLSGLSNNALSKVFFYNHSNNNEKSSSTFKSRKYTKRRLSFHVKRY